MKIELVHPFKDMLPDIDEFFKTDNETGVVNTINAFCHRVELLAEKYQLQIDPNIFKGYALELLVEYICKTNASDNRIGIYDYVPTTGGDNDFDGADGYGIGENQNPATVQVKYHAGNWVLSDKSENGSLSRWLSASWHNHGVRMEDDKNMLLITTGQKLNEYTRETTLYNKIRVLNREALREMFDNRPEWWIQFYELVKKCRVSQSNKVRPVELRQHQKEASKIGSRASIKRGKIILPTGTGKTYIECDIIYKTIVESQRKGVVPIIKINSPRILLCFQLFEEVFKYLNSYGIAARYVNFNSGNNSDVTYVTELRKMGGMFREITSTTSLTELLRAETKAQKEKIPFLVFSTYHSSEKFAQSEIKPHLTIHDEGHNLVSNVFTNVATLPSEKDLFFTATEKVTDSEEDLGMNNPEIFGERIYVKSPKEMIEVGEMVAPWIHVVRSALSQKVDLNKIDRDYEALFHSIAEAFRAHETKIKSLSHNPDELGAKILVVCRGQQDLIEMFKTEGINQFKEENSDIHLYALSSDFGLYNDGEYFKPPVSNLKKFQFLKHIRSLGNGEKCIVFHVDMIGEGIDVPGITGVMPFRNCELCKFFQNIGRASRPHKTDRKNFYEGKISVADRIINSPTGILTSKWIKPCSWIIIPSFLENSDGFESRFRDMILTLRNDFGYVPEQNTIIDNVRGLDEDENIDTVNEKTKNRPHLKSGLKEFDHIFEKMSLTERIIFESKISAKREKFRNEVEQLIKEK